MISIFRDPFSCRTSGSVRLDPTGRHLHSGVEHITVPEVRYLLGSLDSALRIIGPSELEGDRTLQVPQGARQDPNQTFTELRLLDPYTLEVQRLF